MPVLLREGEGVLQVPGFYLCLGTLCCSLPWPVRSSVAAELLPGVKLPNQKLTTATNPRQGTCRVLSSNRHCGRTVTLWELGTPRRQPL